MNIPILRGPVSAKYLNRILLLSTLDLLDYKQVTQASCSREQCCSCTHCNYKMLRIINSKTSHILCKSGRSTCDRFSFL